MTASYFDIICIKTAENILCYFEYVSESCDAKNFCRLKYFGIYHIVVAAAWIKRRTSSRVLTFFW
jgi:hypothetical protein